LIDPFFVDLVDLIVELQSPRRPWSAERATDHTAKTPGTPRKRMEDGRLKIEQYDQ
jgi:hypothetical protein